MNVKHLLLALAILAPEAIGIENIDIREDKHYEANWQSLDSRPIPQWYDEVKFGIFIHWGVFSVPSFGTEWFWERWQGNGKDPKFADFMEKNYPPSFTYADFAKDFTAEFYDPEEWADLFEASGAKYIALTTKHHEGYCNWPTKRSFNWNSMDVGPKRDLVGDLAKAIKGKKDMHFGIYHSLFEWFNPLYLNDKANHFQTNRFVKDKTVPEMVELVQQYEPHLIFSDGQWEATSEYWNSTLFLQWLYNESPVKDSIVVNDRWGRDTICKHGGYLTCSDRHNPGVLQKRKWENAMTIDKHSWGFRRDAPLSDYISVDELISTLSETVACNGNMLMNVGPTKDGRIVPIFEERLRQIGSWLKINGDAIYGTRPWTACQNDTLTPNVWYTTKQGGTPAYGGWESEDAEGALVVYAIVNDWPKGGTLSLGCPQMSATATVSLVGYLEGI